MKSELEHSKLQKQLFWKKQRCPDQEQRGGLLEGCYIVQENKQLTFLSGNLRFSPSHGAHRAYGNGWGTAMAQGEAIFLLLFIFCPVGRTRCEQQLKHSSVLQLLQHSKFDLSLRSWPLFLQVITDVVQHCLWLEGQGKQPQWAWVWSLKIQVCYTEPH